MIDIPILYFGIIGSGLAFCASMVPLLENIALNDLNQFFHLLSQSNRRLFINRFKYSLFWDNPSHTSLLYLPSYHLF